MQDDLGTAPVPEADEPLPATGPVPRRVLGRGTLALLVLLRVYVTVAIPLVGYAFVHALRAQH